MRIPTLLAIAAFITAADQPGDLPVRAVTLYASGVGAFEHGGQVQGDAAVELRFRAKDINDVLKSLVLQDLGGGSAGVVAYPSQEPVERTLKSFRIDLSGAPTVAQVLAQLRGAVVQIEVPGGSSRTGTVMGVETRKVAAGDQAVIDMPHLVLLCDGALRAWPIDQIGGIAPQDAALKADLDRALAALALARDQDQKPVTARFNGNGQRAVRLAYVVEAPVWKASYRLILPRDQAKPEATLQGWAIVENTTQSDWNDIKLTLASGRPVSFIMDLYQSLYAQRQTIQPDLGPNLGPVAFAGGQRDNRAEKKVAANGFSLFGNAAKPAAAPAQEGARLLGGVDDLAGNVSVATTATEDLGAIFTYEIGQVSIGRGRSAMIPVIAGGIQCERVSIWNPNVHPRHPLAGAKLTNSTGNHLAPGPVTVYDAAAYAGDAQVVATPPGQMRLIGYALDQRILVDADHAGGDEVVTLVRIQHGMVETTTAALRTTTYRIDNQSPTATQVVIEHRRMDDGDLIEPAKPLESTPALHRFQVAVPKDGQQTLTVVERHTYAMSWGLLDIQPEILGLWIDGKDTPANFRQELLKVRDLIAAWQAEVQAANQARSGVEELAKEQARIRENLRTVGQNTDFGRQQVQKLAEHETRIDQLRMTAANKDQAAQAARAKLEQAVGAIDLAR